MKYYITFIIVALLSIFFMILAPMYADKSKGKELEKSIAAFKDNSDLGQDIFKNFTIKGRPKTIEGFNFEKLNELGKKIGVDFSDTIKKIKAPHGSYWIESALSMSIIGNIHKMSGVILGISFSTLKQTDLLTIIALILSVLLFMITKKQIDETGKKSTTVSIIIGAAAILGLIAFLITKSSDFMSLIKNPLTCLCPPFDTASIFTHHFIVMALEMIFVLTISLKLIFGSSKNSKEAFFWVIPMIAIILGLFSLNAKVTGLRSRVQTQNMYYKRQKIMNDENNAIYTIRQWAKSNGHNDFTKFSAKELNIPAKSEYSDYQITTDGAKITIINTTPYKSDFDKKEQFKVIYDVQSDSIKSKMIPVTS